MKKLLFGTASACFLVGFFTVLLGALYRIQGWENPAFFGANWGPLSIGLALNFTGLVLLCLSMIVHQPAPDAETKLNLDDLPTTVAEAEKQLRDEEGMIL